MTVEVERYIAELAWTGNESIFATGIQAQSKSHIGVTYLQDGATETMTLIDGVHLSLVRDPTTEIINAFPLTMPVPVGVVTFERTTPALQGTDFKNLVAFTPAVHTRLHDVSALRDQELSGRIEGLKVDFAAVVALIEAAISLLQQSEPINVPTYDTRLAVSLATIEPTVKSLQTRGCNTGGDRGGRIYKRVPSEPSHFSKVRSNDRFMPNGASDVANGGWWEDDNLATGPVEAVGAKGDGTTDDGIAFKDACATFGRVTLGKRTYRIARCVLVLKPTELIGAGQEHSIIKCDMGLGQGLDSPAGTNMLFDIETSGFHAADFSVDGTGFTHTPATTVHYGFMLGWFGTPLQDISFLRVKIKDFLFGDGLSMLANLIASHAIVNSAALTKLSVIDCVFENVAGSGTFIVNCADLTIWRNVYRNCTWYPINLDFKCDGFDIGWNAIESLTGTFWGAGINGQCQPPGFLRNGSVHDNRVTGVFGYGSAIRILSPTHLAIERNTIENWSIMAGTPVSPDGMVGILVGTRGVFSCMLNTPGGLPAGFVNDRITVTTISAGLTSGAYDIVIGSEVIHGVIENATTIYVDARAKYGTVQVDHPNGIGLGNRNSPPSEVHIAGNLIYSPLSVLTNASAINVGNGWWPEGNPGHMIAIDNNACLQNINSAGAFRNGIVVQGTDGGLQEVRVAGNRVQTMMTATAGYTGAISMFGAAPASQLANILIEGNQLSDLGNGTQAFQTAIYGFTASNVVFGVNILASYNRGLSMDGTVTMLRNPYQQQMSLGAGGIEYLIGTPTPIADSRIYQATAAALAALANGINQVGKYPGKRVFVTDTNKTVTATGTVGNATWVDDTGAVVYTPV